MGTYILLSRVTDSGAATIKDHPEGEGVRCCIECQPSLSVESLKGTPLL